MTVWNTKWKRWLRCWIHHPHPFGRTCGVCYPPPPLTPEQEQARCEAEEREIASIIRHWETKTGSFDPDRPRRFPYYGTPTRGGVEPQNAPSSPPQGGSDPPPSPPSGSYRC